MLDSARIKAKARDLQFDACGIAPAGAHPELSFFREWLDRGYAADMAWLARSASKRADVRNVVPEARSVVVTATVYNTDRPYSIERSDPARAGISRYAWGDDYHDVIARRLDALLAWLREEAPQPFDARAYVDTGPVQERVYAQYAGLGWIGKNTCLISPDLGSWLFLAEIITTLDLTADERAFDQCGDCALCIEACPTGAIVGAGVLDSSRCISYLTIEQRGDVGEPLRSLLGSHVYGCDVCQEVCPWNQRAPISSDGAWQPRGAWDAPAIEDLRRRTDEELQANLRGSAMRRTKLAGLRRNLDIAAGNMDRAQEERIRR